MARKFRSSLDELQWIDAKLRDLRSCQGRCLSPEDERKLRRSIRYYERKLDQPTGQEGG